MAMKTTFLRNVAIAGLALSALAVAEGRAEPPEPAAAVARAAGAVEIETTHETELN